MRKIFIATIVLLFTLAIIVTYIWNDAMLKIEAANAKIKSKVGLNLLLNGDTLTIVNYSLLDDTYTLSNGAEISVALIDSTNTFKP